jgi:DUF4097 and DUF4098 domain-containing protein YvlB
MRRTCLLVAALLLASCSKVEFKINNVGDGRRVEETVSKTFQTKATPRIVVDVPGGVDVKAADGNEVKADVTKWANRPNEDVARDYLKTIDIQITQDGDTVRITASRADKSFENAGADAKLQVPAGATLDLHGLFGAMTVTGITGDTSATTANGAVTVKGGKGDLKLKSDFGKINVDGVYGTVTAKTANGEVRVKGAKGPLDVSSQFGAIDVDAPADDVKASTSNGSVKIRGGSGKVHARSQFGGIDIEGDKLRVDAETANGAVRFAGSLAEGENVMRSQFGSLTALLPRDARFRLDASTDFGRVSTGFKVNSTGAAGEKHLIGAVGDDPKTTLKLRTSNGSIDVKTK